MKKPSIHKIQTTASSKLFKIEAIDLEFSSGEKRQFERVNSHGNGAG
jgi:ADP-ribose diphosphatase